MRKLRVGPGLAQKHAIDWPATRFSSVGWDKAQRRLARPLRQALNTQLWAAADENDHVRLAQLRGAWQAAWLTTLPTEQQQSMRNEEFAAAIRQRLGVDPGLWPRIRAPNSGHAVAELPRCHTLVRDRERRRHHQIGL